MFAPSRRGPTHDTFIIRLAGRWVEMQRGEMTPLRLAGFHARDLRANGRTWVKIRRVPGGPRVALEYGTIHSNGQHERAIATREFYPTDEYECGVHYWTAIHV